jgi:drug/metabolite transporter (DMT)-like permease
MFSGIVDRDFGFTGRGFTFATLGGVAGAAGALCIILSIRFQGDPLYIAPLVFAGAPLVNAIVSMLWHPKGLPDWKFFAGIILAAIGAGLVLYSKGELDKRPESALIQAPGVETAPSGAASHD